MHELQKFDRVAKIPPVDLTMEEAVAMAMHMGVTAGLVHSGRRWKSRDEIVELGLAILEGLDAMTEVRKAAAANADLLLLRKIFGEAERLKPEYRAIAQ